MTHSTKKTKQRRFVSPFFSASRLTLSTKLFPLLPSNPTFVLLLGAGYIFPQPFRLSFFLSRSFFMRWTVHARPSKFMINISHCCCLLYSFDLQRSYRFTSHLPLATPLFSLGARYTSLSYGSVFLFAYSFFPFCLDQKCV